MAQFQIGRALRGVAERERVAAILSQEQFGSRRAFGRRICREFPFFDAAGRLQVSGCLKALSALAGEDPGIVLPPSAASAVDRTPRQLPSGVAEPVGVPPHPSQIRGLAITASASDRALWNTLIACEHPRGLTTFAGCQVRHLFGSAQRGFPPPRFGRPPATAGWRGATISGGRISAGWSA